jgi:NCK-associated protein 1
MRVAGSVSRGTPASHQKIAERLTILNNRAPGMLTRLYNLKKQLADPKTRPAFMAKREMQAAIQAMG